MQCRYDSLLLARRGVLWCAVVFILLAPMLHGAVSDTDGHARSFTVKDSIERVTFSDPEEASGGSSCRPSPDGTKFVLVTTKGDLSSNQIESTIWLYVAADVSSHLRENQGRLAPQRLWSWKGVPKTTQSNSYGSLITRLAWSADSKSLLFLNERPDGLRHLAKLSLTDRRVTLLSQPDQDVEDLSEGHGTIAYVALRAVRPSNSPSTTTAAGSLVTGNSLFHLFDPVSFPDPQSLYRSADLWVWRDGKTMSLNRTTHGVVWTYPISARALFHIAVSPSGKGIIAARPAEYIEESWRSFHTYLPRLDLKHMQTPKGDAGIDWDWPWQYIYFDLDTRASWPLVNAPSSAAAGYGGTAAATWSEDEQFVLVTNAFMPLSSGIAAEQHLDACSAGVISMAVRVTTCLAYSQYPAKQVRLQSAVFFGSDQEVLLSWSDGTREFHRFTHGRWQKGSPVDLPQQEARKLRLELRQALNEAPAIWATDSGIAESRKIWDPNLQLQHVQLGQVSLYEWTDSSNYHWTAGLILPPSYRPGHRYPLAVQTHGFRKGQYLVDGPYTTAFAAQALASRGMIVLQLEDRSDRHLKPTDQEAKLFALGCVEAIHHLEEDGLVDPGRVGIVGFSRTSWYVQTALELYPEIFRAAVIVDGVNQSYMSYLLFCPTTSVCRSDMEAANGGSPFGDGLQRWSMAAVGFHTDRIKAAVRIEAIRWYSLLEEWELYSSLKQQNKIVELHYIPDGQHILQQPQQRYASQQGTVAWLAHWLLDQ